MSELTAGKLRELLKDSPDDAEVSVGATIEYTKQKSAIDTTFNAIMCTLTVIAAILILILLGVSIGDKAQTIKIVRDTIYVKAKYEVEVKGPDGYVVFFNDQHGFDLTEPDGKYHFKMQQSN